MHIDMMILTIHNGEDAIPPRLLVGIISTCLPRRPTDITTLPLRFAVNAGGMYSELDASKGFGKGGQERKGRLLALGVFLLHREVNLSIGPRVSIQILQHAILGGPIQPCHKVLYIRRKMSWPAHDWPRPPTSPARYQCLPCSLAAGWRAPPSPSYRSGSESPHWTKNCVKTSLLGWSRCATATRQESRRCA